MEAPCTAARRPLVARRAASAAVSRAIVWKQSSWRTLRSSPSTTPTSPAPCKEWTTRPDFSSPLVDHLPKVAGVPSPKDVLGHHIGEPKKLTYYADILKYYRALAAASPRVKVVTIGKSNEGRDLVVVFVGSDESIKNLEQYRGYLGAARRPAHDHDGAGRGDHRQGEAALPPVGRSAQRRGRAVGDADGAGVSRRRRRLAARQRRFATR